MDGFAYTFGVATDPGRGHYTTITYNVEHGLDPAYSNLHNASITAWVAENMTGPHRTWSKWGTCVKCGLDYPESEMTEYEGQWYCQEDIRGVIEQDSDRDMEDWSREETGG